MESFISATWAEPRTPGSMVFQDSLSMPSLRWALKWPKRPARGAAVKAVVSLAKAFGGGHPYGRGDGELSCRAFTAARVHGRSCERSAGEAGTTRRPPIAWRLLAAMEGCEEPSITSRGECMLVYLRADQACLLHASVFNDASYYFLPVSARCGP